MRVYLPSTLARLAVLRRDGVLPGPHAACAVTADLREWYGDGDEEELEWAASQEAALAALELLADDPAVARRRVVLPVDVAADAVSADPDLGPAGVRVAADVPLSAVASVHVDDAAVAPLVERAVGALAAYEAGDPAAAAAVEALDDAALEWYDPAEVDDLLG